MMRISSLVFVLAIAGCGGKAKPAPAPIDSKAKITDGKPADPPPAASGGDTEAQKRGLALMLKLGDVMAASSGDCPKLGAAMKAFVAENKAAIGEINAEEKKLGAEAMKAFEDRHKAEMDKFKVQAEPVLRKCASDPGVGEAIQAFEGSEG